ncbi:MAG: hypothetical protein Q4G69_14880 [Planctomycetia bacterium]|nr:hypothetical protein [Planctomycetia bacterium]
MSDSISFLKKIQELVPWLDRSAKEELKYLNELQDLFPCLSLKELVGELKKYQKARRLSPEGFCDRLREWLDQSPRDLNLQEDLIRDFALLPAASVKKTATIFGLNLSSAKKDGPAFAEWLATGVKPPSAEDLIREELTEQAKNFIEIQNESMDYLNPSAIESLMLIAEQVKKNHKVAGLQLFLSLIGYPSGNPKATGPALIKMLRQKLDTLSVDRFKAFQIDSQNREK